MVFSFNVTFLRVAFTFVNTRAPTFDMIISVTRTVVARVSITKPKEDDSATSAYVRAERLRNTSVEMASRMAIVCSVLAKEISLFLETTDGGNGKRLAAGESTSI